MRLETRSESTDPSAQRSAPRGCTNFKLRQLLRVVSRLYDVELAKAGLKTTQFSLLSHLAVTSPVQPGELALRMDMDASTLTRNLRVLAEQGWAVQGPGADARSRLIEITSAGRQKVSQARRHWKSAQLTLNARLGAPQVAALHRLIDYGLEQLRVNEPAESAQRN